MPLAVPSLLFLSERRWRRRRQITPLTNHPLKKMTPVEEEKNNPERKKRLCNFSSPVRNFWQAPLPLSLPGASFSRVRSRYSSSSSLPDRATLKEEASFFSPPSVLESCLAALKCGREGEHQSGGDFFPSIREKRRRRRRRRK